MGRRSVSSDVVRNIELLVGVALPLFLTGVWIQDHLTGSGHWAHPLESAFFEWLSLVPVLAFVGLLHSVAVAMVLAIWPRAAGRAVALVLAVLMVPLLVLAGRPVDTLARYAFPLLVALVVYALASRIPGAHPAPPEEDLHTAPLREQELLGHEPSRPVLPVRHRLPPEPGPPAVTAPAREVR